MSKYAIAQPTITVDQRGMLIPLETLDVKGNLAEEIETERDER